MNSHKIKKEEYDTTRAEIAKAESLWDKNFPQDYVDFLLQYNGAITYPNWPNLGPENKTEIWGVERFFSIGDVIIQKLYPMTYTLHDIDEEDFQEHNLDPKNILVFAQGDRGIYFFNLSNEEYGQIYIANFSGGDGISKTSCNSFSKFLNSLGLPEWDDEVELDVNFEFSTDYNSSMKVMQWHMFHTPDNPELGFQRFKEVFEYTGDIVPKEDGYPTIIQKYSDDRLKLNYLIKNGCSTEGLLTSTRQAETIKYLVEELNLDINKKYKRRYPLQNYLSIGYNAQFAYGEMHKLLEMGIEMDWSIQGKLYNGEDDLPMIEKLRILHEKYIELKIEEDKFRKKYNRPSGRSPFIKSKLIEQKLGIEESVKDFIKQEKSKNTETESWIDRILNKIARGNK
ncbi:MAG: SMI1/KNR4 family protein [Saprospiraceae bacterium]